MPRVSVLLPVYNCEKYIKETLDSVLTQTFSDFELIIIDDCSTDNTVDIIKSFKDSRISFIQKEKNSGYTDSLNYRIDIAEGEYIARMDGDDVCAISRFEKQVNFLDNNPEVMLCGTSIQVIGTDNVLRHPQSHEEIKVKLCFGTAFCHPSVMGRKEVFKENNYNKDFEPAEDYELWTRLVFKGRLANIDEILLFYRAHSGQISNTKKDIQHKAVSVCRKKMLDKLNLQAYFSEQEISKVVIDSNPTTLQDCKLGLSIFNFLKNSNKQEFKIYDIALFDKKIESLKISFLRKYFTKKKILKIASILFFLRELTIHEFLNVCKNMMKKSKKNKEIIFE